MAKEDRIRFLRSKIKGFEDINKADDIRPEYKRRNKYLMDYYQQEIDDIEELK
jgi:hypothetical protein